MCAVPDGALGVHDEVVHRVAPPRRVEREFDTVVAPDRAVAFVGEGSDLRYLWLMAHKSHIQRLRVGEDESLRRGGGLADPVGGDEVRWLCALLPQWI